MLQLIVCPFIDTCLCYRSDPQGNRTIGRSSEVGLLEPDEFAMEITELRKAEIAKPNSANNIYLTLLSTFGFGPEYPM